MLRLLLDQGIPRDAVALLAQQPLACEHVADLGMHAASDEEILALAARTGAVILTLDADFHMLVALRGLKAPSVIRLRKEGCQAAEVVRLVAPILETYAEALTSGCLISMRGWRATVHRLPIGG